MNYSSNQIGLTQATVYDISAADLAGANSGQRPDLLAKTQAIFRTPDGKLYSANAARSQLVAAAVPITAETNPITGKVTGLVGPDGSAISLTSSAIAQIYPIPTNNQWALIGDSRSANSTEDSNTFMPNRLTAYGLAAWIQHFSNYRGRFVGNFGINGNTLAQVQSRLNPAASAVGTGAITMSGGVATFTDTTHTSGAFAVGQQLFGTGVAPGTYITALQTGTGSNAGGTYTVLPPQNVASTAISAYPQRANILGSAASVFVMLIGVNNGTNPVTTDGPVYQSVINALVAAGKIVVVLNEFPNSDQSGNGAVHYNRRRFLDGAAYLPYSSKVIKFNSYDVMAASPTSYQFKTGYLAAGDFLHPNLQANRDLGQRVGAVLDAIFQMGNFAPRNNLPTYAGDTGFGIAAMMTGTTGTLGTATGQLATGWSMSSIPAGYTVTCSKGTDPDGYEQQVISISGTAGSVGTVQSVGINNYSLGGAFASSGDVVSAVSRIIVDAGSVGFVGPTAILNAQDSTNNVTQNATQLSGTVYNSVAMDGAWAGTAFDGQVMTQPITLPSGANADWTGAASKSLQPNFQFCFLGGIAVQATIRISRVGIVKNA
jgi:hypothetical protein